MVGPFVFLDQMGPAAIGEHPVEVLSHPHIGLSTVTYLFEGQGEHRDSLGVVQRIAPGDINWMTAGSGVVHAERMVGASSAAGAPPRVFGVQLWVALPKALEEAAPSFVHYDAAQIPVGDESGVSLTVMAGQLFGLTSPVKTSSELFYAELRLEPSRGIELLPTHDERAVYVVEGEAQLAGQSLSRGALAVLERNRAVRVAAAEAPVRLIYLGGEPLDGPRHIYWNFVASSKERIEQAKRDWRAGAFAKVPGEQRFIPLPEDGAAPVAYP